MTVCQTRHPEGTMLPPQLNSERERILESALAHIPSHGWTERSLRIATIDAGFEESMARRAFPRGINDLIDTYLSKADDLMLLELQKCSLNNMPVRDRIRTAVRLRLEQSNDQREAIRRLIALQCTPQHIGSAILALHQTVDKIWRAAGDKSADFNFYTKRALLAGVYGATTLFWLDDRSAGHSETWQFLDCRINDVMRLQKARSKYEHQLKHVDSTAGKYFRRLAALI